MKLFVICLGCVWVAATVVHAEVPRTRADYQIILDRQPFGTPPPRQSAAGADHPGARIFCGHDDVIGDLRRR